jgi:hypothetical protein
VTTSVPAGRSETGWFFILRMARFSGMFQMFPAGGETAVSLRMMGLWR